MAQFYKFFNSTLNDEREYFAQYFADYFGSVLSTGLLHTDEIPGMQASVEQGTMNTIVSDGKAIMKGHMYENTTPHKLEHNLPEPDLDRIDRVVLRLNMGHAERNILLHIIEGESADNPVPPELQRDNFIHEISLAQVRIRAGASTIRQEDLRDERLDEDLCGLVYSLISVPTSQFLEQWNLFFSNISDEMQQTADDYKQLLLNAEQAFQDDKNTFEQQWDDWFSNQQTEGFVMQNEKGKPDGIPVLDSDGQVPHEQLPPMDYIPTSEKGAPGGVATLDGGRNLIQKPYVTGTYVGNGAESRNIALGFRPSAVLVVDHEGRLTDGYYAFGGFAITSYPAGEGVVVYASGFRVSTQSSYYKTNNSGIRYRYMAWR